MKLPTDSSSSTTEDGKSSSSSTDEQRDHDRPPPPIGKMPKQFFFSCSEISSEENGDTAASYSPTKMNGSNDNDETTNHRNDAQTSGSSGGGGGISVVSNLMSIFVPPDDDKNKSTTKKDDVVISKMESLDASIQSQTKKPSPTTATSNLMGLFVPPESSGLMERKENLMTTPSSKEKVAAVTSSVQKASKLMGLFQPPDQQQQVGGSFKVATPPSTKSNTRGADDWNGESSVSNSNLKTPRSGNHLSRADSVGKASKLMGLFVPPPESSTKNAGEGGENKVTPPSSRQLIKQDSAKRPSKLVGLFKPPSSQSSEKREGSSSNLTSPSSSQNNDSPDKQDSVRKASKLTGLFKSPQSSSSDTNDINNTSSRLMEEKSSQSSSKIPPPSRLPPERRTTAKFSNLKLDPFEDWNDDPIKEDDQYHHNTETTSLLQQQPNTKQYDTSQKRRSQGSSSFRSSHYSIPLNDSFKDIDDIVDSHYDAISSKQQPQSNWHDDDLKFSKSLFQSTPSFRQTPKHWKKLFQWKCCDLKCIQQTLIGSFTFVLYHTVFCLTMASAITRPHADSSTSILGPMAKIGALGSIICGPIFIVALGGDFPALYPALDLFLAPFFAHLAVVVDDTLYEEGLEGEDDVVVFFATFGTLCGLGLLLSGILTILGSKFKLANVGAYLPYPVLAGFFAAVGILLWMLAFSVDNDGLTVQTVMMSGDISLMIKSWIHHLPSLVVGIAMCLLGPRHPFYITGLILVTIGVVYAVMGICGVSLEEAQELKWFWKKEELVFDFTGYSRWPPTTPFGVFISLLHGNVNTTAILRGLPIAFAMAFIFTLRCSLHATALKKNVTQMRKKDTSQDEQQPPLTPSGVPKASKGKSKELPDALRALMWYGNTQCIGALTGGFALVPCVAASITLFNLGAEGVAPQFGSLLLLFFIYLDDFKLVSYIPKMVFSCVLVLTFVDVMINWFIKSFMKTKNKWEWMVVPLIVVLSYVIGMLMSVAVGVAISTFIFVATFYRTGVVKFLANGLTVRSTIERNFHDAAWLDQHADLIQILVLQNYLFFGNATSCLNYISTMFEDVPFVNNNDPDFPLPPIPKYLIIDFTIVTGMDTSAVDVFAEIVSLCKLHSCRIYMSGLSRSLKSILIAGGVKPGGNNEFVLLKFDPELESALGKAEDGLLTEVFNVEEKDREKAGMRRRARLMSEDDDGFLYALRQIDEQHGISYARELQKLNHHTTPVEIGPGESLSDCLELMNDDDRGLFFIEHGIMKVERDPSYSISRSIGRSTLRPTFATPRFSPENNNSIGHLKARTHTIGKEAAFLKNNPRSPFQQTSHTFRLARIGPGWVVGTLEGCAGLRNPGMHVAVTPCRLHHLKYKTIQELEITNPALILSLFKMISCLAARRQDITIEQLATLHSIMVSRGVGRPVNRMTMAAVRKAMQYQ